MDRKNASSFLFTFQKKRRRDSSNIKKNEDDDDNKRDEPDVRDPI